jgi:hypothetical protein
VCKSFSHEFAVVEAARPHWPRDLHKESIKSSSHPMSTRLACIRELHSGHRSGIVGPVCALNK